MSKFSHLHVHTQFSLLDGAASIQNLYKKAIEDGMPVGSPGTELEFAL